MALANVDVKFERTVHEETLGAICREIVHDFLYLPRYISCFIQYWEILKIADVGGMSPILRPHVFLS